MAERCSYCGRPFATTAHEQTLGTCHDHQGFGCLRSRIAKLEAVVEAQAKVIELLEQTSGGGCGCPLCIRELSAAKAELERVKG